MKFYETLLEDQETTFSVQYKEQNIKIYSSEPQTIQRLISALGQPQIKYKKSKTYWSGASWEVSFFEADKLKKVLTKEIFIDKNIKSNVSKKTKKQGSKSSKEKIEKVDAKVTKKVSKKNAVKNKKNAIKKESKFEQIQLFI